MDARIRIGAAVLVAIIIAGVMWRLRGNSSALRPATLAIPTAEPPPRPEDFAALVDLPGGVFLRGRSGGGYDVQPVRRIVISPFSIEVCEVTNARFKAFVEATGYRTTAERQGFGRVFLQQQRKTVEVAGASWRHPEGPESTIVGREETPVVQVSWEDAAAFAKWDNRRLPTEAEFEYAARGGLADYDYPWRPKTPEFEGQWLANIWQGDFPQRPSNEDGYPRMAGVASFPPNPWGLYDTVGNAREWCADRYADDYYQVSPNRDPPGPDESPRDRTEVRVARGGSWLSPQSTYEPTVWRRVPLPAQWCDDQTSFRCAK